MPITQNKAGGTWVCPVTEGGGRDLVTGFAASGDVGKRPEAPILGVNSLRLRHSVRICSWTSYLPLFTPLQYVDHIP